VALVAEGFESCRETLLSRYSAQSATGSRKARLNQLYIIREHAEHTVTIPKRKSLFHGFEKAAGSDEKRKRIRKEKRRMSAEEKISMRLCGMMLFLLLQTRIQFLINKMNDERGEGCPEFDVFLRLLDAANEFVRI